MRPQSFKDFCAEKDRAKASPGVVEEALDDTVADPIMNKPTIVDPRQVKHPMSLDGNILIGQKFGKLTIGNGFTRDGRKFYYCDCDCGTKDTVLRHKFILNGKEQDCGCGYTERMRMRDEDPENYKEKIAAIKRRAKLLEINSIVGNQYGRLTVVRAGETSKRGQRKYYCSCDCGGTVWAYKHHLVSGNTKSCGCLKVKHKIQIAQRYNMLVVCHDDGTRSRNREIMWLCRCDCQNMTHVRGQDLAKSRVQSCGCLRGKKPNEKKPEGWVDGI